MHNNKLFSLCLFLFVSSSLAGILGGGGNSQDTSHFNVGGGLINAQIGEILSSHEASGTYSSTGDKKDDKKDDGGIFGKKDDGGIFGKKDDGGIFGKKDDKKDGKKDDGGLFGTPKKDDKPGPNIFDLFPKNNDKPAGDKPGGGLLDLFPKKDDKPKNILDAILGAGKLFGKRSTDNQSF